MWYTIYIILSFVVLIGFFVSFYSQRVAMGLAQKYQIYDDFNNRKIRKSPRPRLGGLGIFIGFFTAFYVLFFVVYLLQDTPYYIFIDFTLFQIMLYVCSMIFFFLLGLYDDFKGLKAFQKLGVELVIATILFFIGFRIELLTLPFMADSINVGLFIPHDHFVDHRYCQCHQPDRRFGRVGRRRYRHCLGNHHYYLRSK